MIIEKDVEITAGARNLSSIRKYYPYVNKGSVVIVPQNLCVEISGCTILDCICENCSKEYKQSAGRIKELPLRERYCGDCMFLIGQENMKNTMKTEEFRNKRSEITKNFYQTSYGKEVAIKKGKKCSEYLKTRPDLIEKYAKHLKHKSGEEHPNWNPNKTEMQEYIYKVRFLTEKTYKENVDIINPNNYQRTLCGIEGGYQLDHIISVKYGFENNIPAEVISSLDNLQMLSWEENRKKWHQ